jgi:hypothetical protein
MTLDSLGYVHHLSVAAAHNRWRQALAILDEFADPGADLIRAKLDG